MKNTRAYEIRHNGDAWTIVPADGPGGVVVALKIIVNNVHVVSLPDGALHLSDCELKVNGLNTVPTSQDATVDLATFFPPPRTVKVEPIRAYAKG